MRSVLLVLGLAACGAAPSPIADARAAADNGNAADLDPSEARRAVRVDWSNVRSTPGCFFFSGPLDLGRDDHLGPSAVLERTPSGATLAFDGGPTFVGHVMGSALSVGRSAPHEFGGIWTSRETIALSVSGAAWIGTYHYDEIDPSTGTAGTCHVDATILVVP